MNTKHTEWERVSNGTRAPHFVRGRLAVYQDAIGRWHLCLDRVARFPFASGNLHAEAFLTADAAMSAAS